MKTLYFDIIDGISGDMIVASLLDLVGSKSYLEKELAKVKIKGYRIELISSKTKEYKAKKFIVRVDESGGGIFQFEDIKRKIANSHLNSRIKDRALKVYKKIYAAERNVHSNDHVHFHQVGEVDSLVDIFSSCILFDFLEVNKIYYSCVPFGHNVALATAHMLKGKEVILSKHRFENITPTGIAIITSLGAQRKDWAGDLKLANIGYGTGSTQNKDSTNMLRSILFSGAIAEVRDRSFEEDQAVVVQTVIDDMSPQILAYLSDLLYEEGALEVYVESITTKKSRMGILFSVLSKEEIFDRIVEIIFRQTTTLGVRYFKVNRLKLRRREGYAATASGKVRFKETIGAQFRKVIPEYDDCVSISRKNKKPLKDIILNLQTKRKKNGSFGSRDL